MRTRARIATAAAVAAIGIGATATAASAYSWDPPSTSFTGASIGDHVFALGGTVVSCTGASYGGATPASGPTLNFRPAFSGCTYGIAGLTLSATVTITTDWSLTVTGGTGPFSANLGIFPAGSGHAMVVDVPDLVCEIYIDGQGPRSTVTGANVTPTGVQLVANVSALAYTENGNCAVGAGSGMYTGVTNVPGVTIAP